MWGTLGLSVLPLPIASQAIRGAMYSRKRREMQLLNDLARARFVKGLLLAWIPLLVVMGPFFAEAFRDISNQKATGLGAVAGGLSQALTTFGLAALVVTQIAAIVLLARSFGRKHLLRSTLSMVTICCSVLLMAYLGMLAWLLVRYGRW